MSKTLHDIAGLLKKFPKKRPLLPDAYVPIYSREYHVSRQGQTVYHKAVLRFEEWMHRAIASRAFPRNTILEIGAGSLNHVPFEREYALYDIVEPQSSLYSDSPNIRLVHNLYSDIQDVSKESRYSRIVSVAVFEHLLELPKMICEAAVRLAPQGVLQTAIPSEGEFLWEIVSRYTTGIAFLMRTGLSYLPFIKSEHVNSAKEIEEVLRIFFRRVQIRRYPFMSPRWSVYTYLEASDPDVDLCNQYIRSL